jgi:hypothetical protein
MAVVTIKLTIGNVAVEVTGPSAYADKKFDKLVEQFLTSRKTLTPENSAPIAALDKGGKKTSAAEFLKKSTARNQFDRAMLLGYYTEKSGASSFTSGELVRLGKETKQPFTNASDAIAKLSGRGLMMSAGDKDGARAYALTASGEAYVEAMLEAKL